MPKMEGSYTAARDSQKYTYEVTWRPAGASTHWEAKVRLNDQLVAIPSGQVLAAEETDLIAALRREVESAIEHRISLD